MTFYRIPLKLIIVGIERNTYKLRGKNQNKTTMEEGEMADGWKVERAEGWKREG